VKAPFPKSGPERRLAASWLIKTIGSGLYLPSSALYFTRVVGLSAQDVGYGLAVAGLVSLAAAVPLGSLSDRFGALRVYPILLTLQCLAMAALSTVRSYVLFVLVITVFTALEQGSNAARGALVANVGEGAERIRLRARLRVVTNIGISIGAGLASLVLQINTPAAYSALLLITALTYPAAALPLRRLPPDPPAPPIPSGTTPEPATTHSVFTDRRYIAMTALATVLTLQAQVLSFAVPLWITGHTKAPRLLVAIVVILNTALVILFQTRAARGTEDTQRAARLCRRSGLALLAACAVIAPSGRLTAPGATLLLLAFAVLLTLGELWFSAGTFSLSFNLAPDSAHGRYQGFFSLAKGISAAAAPVLLSALCLSSTGTGWLWLGLLFAAAGAAMPAAVLTAPRLKRDDANQLELGK
jgi:MFS family permease